MNRGRLLLGHTSRSWWEQARSEKLRIGLLKETQRAKQNRHSKDCNRQWGSAEGSRDRSRIKQPTCLNTKRHTCHVSIFLKEIGEQEDCNKKTWTFG